jgi:hypothetical protein
MTRRQPVANIMSGLGIRSYSCFKGITITDGFCPRGCSALGLTSLVQYPLWRVLVDPSQVGLRQ